jgi:phosphate transport system substrate-binding protein
MQRSRRVAAALAASILLSPAAVSLAAAKTTITISGATASFPLVSLLAQRYQKLNHKVRFRISQGGTQVGINDIAAGRVSIADVSRDPLPADPAGLFFYPIAKYYLCIVTNKDNPLANITQAQAEAIFTGKLRDWNQVPGARASGTIDLISRNSTAGTISNFQTLLLGGKKVSSLAAEEPSEGLQRQQIENDPHAIGFLSGYFATSGVNRVGYNGVACTLSNADSGNYAGVGRFYEVTKGAAKGTSLAFINWIQHSRPARRIISSQWQPVK